MDKSWIWKKKSTEKSIVVDDKPNILLKKNAEEAPMSNKAEHERDGRFLDDNFPPVLSDSNARDELAKKQARIAQEAIAGWEISETEGISLKLELEKALQQRAASEERLIHVDAALKECMQQLRFVREEQEKRIHDAVMKASNEFQRWRMELHVKLDEASKRLAKADFENTQQSKALLMKEKVIEELNKHKATLEIDLNTLMTRLESTEKEKASLKYELRVLEKELEIRNEEREFNRRTADNSQKQHLEHVKKIAKLESECQRLRLLVRKRLPGPAALVKMKNEAEMLSKDQPETRRRKSNPPLIGSMDFSMDMASESPRNQINYLTQQLYVIEEDNRTLREALNKKTNELQFSRTMFAQTASKLSQLEGRLGDHSVAEPGKTLYSTHELALGSMSDPGSDDKLSCAESWASALLSELEQFKNGKQEGTPSNRTVGASDMSLMDDFVEMEKLAVVALDNIRFENSSYDMENKVAHSHLTVQSSGNVSEAAVPASILDPSDLSVSNHHYQSKDVTSNKRPGWLEEILQIILEKSEAVQRNPDDVLEEIKGALLLASHPNSVCVVSKESSNHLDTFGAPNNMAPRSPGESFMVESLNAGAGSNISTAKKSNQKVHSNLSSSIHKIIELIEGISMQSLHDGNSEVSPKKNDLHYRSSETSTGYMVRLFQWKTCELSATLKQFVQVCNDLLNEKCDLENFAEQLKCTLNWIMNHCFSLQDVSSMKDAIKNHLDWDESRSESEVDSGMVNHFSESNKMHGHGEEPSPSPSAPVPNCHNSHFQVEDVQHHGKGEDGRLKNESPSESAKKDMEGRLQSEIFKSDSLIIQLQESGKTIESLQKEVETLKQLKEKFEDQSKKHELVEEDLEMQLANARSELSRTCEEVMYLDKELENKSSSCEKLDPTCHDLQLKLESFNKREAPDDKELTGMQLRTESEIATASEKLAECQETILNLGKQLKALASPAEAALFEKVIITPADNCAATETTPKAVSNPAETIEASMTTPEKKVNQRSSLRDKMLAEDKVDTADLKSPKTKEIILDGNKSASCTDEAPDTQKKLTSPIEGDHHKRVAVGSLAIVPSKKKGGRGLLRKLLGIGKKKSGKKTDLLVC